MVGHVLIKETLVPNTAATAQNVDSSKCVLPLDCTPLKPTPVKPKPKAENTHLNTPQTFTKCDKLFLDGKITRERWKAQCFAHDNLVPEREKLIRKFEEREKIETSEQLSGQFQLRIGPELVHRVSLFRNVYRIWNSSLPLNSSENMPSNDGIIDRGNRVGGRLALTTGPALTRLLSTNWLFRGTLFDMALYDGNTDIGWDSSDTTDVTISKFEFLYPIYKYNFIELGGTLLEKDLMWWKYSRLGRSYHLGYALQVWGAPMDASDAERSVNGLGATLSDYALIGFRAEWAAVQSLERSKRSYFCQNAGSQCVKFSAAHNNDPYYNRYFFQSTNGPWNFLEDLRSDPIDNPYRGDQIRLRMHFLGENRFESGGFLYDTHADLYPAWNIVDLSAKLTAYLDKGKFRFQIDGSMRKLWSYSDHDDFWVRSAYEYAARISLGFIPFK
jgi:hypothetical protein